MHLSRKKKPKDVQYMGYARYTKVRKNHTINSGSWDLNPLAHQGRAAHASPSTLRHFRIFLFFKVLQLFILFAKEKSLTGQYYFLR